MLAADWPTRHAGADAADGKPTRLRMSPAEIPRHWIPDTMTTRSAALITIGLLAVLLAFVALAALFSPDISERAGGIVSSVLGTFATVLAGLLLFLRVETVSTKADDAAAHAEVAAKKAVVLEQKVDQVQDFVTNGGMRQNVKKAVSEERHEHETREAERRARRQATEASD